MNSLRRTGIGMTSPRTRERLVERLREQGIDDPRVLEALRHTPRHLFVDEALEHRAYDNVALPIGAGQTISQPFIVALMTQTLLAASRCDRVLEIGTGCGYQTAVLAGLVDHVYTIERIASLQRDAREVLFELGIGNVSYRFGDGFKGWPEQAPFDGILVAAAPPEVPVALLEQLAVGGRLVIPIGQGSSQELLLVERTAAGYVQQVVDLVTFVPMLPGTSRG